MASDGRGTLDPQLHYSNLPSWPSNISPRESYGSQQDAPPGGKQRRRKVRMEERKFGQIEFLVIFELKCRNVGQEGRECHNEWRDGSRVEAVELIPWKGPTGLEWRIREVINSSHRLFLKLFP